MYPWRHWGWSAVFSFCAPEAGWELCYRMEYSRIEGIVT